MQCALLQKNSRNLNVVIREWIQHRIVVQIHCSVLLQRNAQIVYSLRHPQPNSLTESHVGITILHLLFFFKMMASQRGTVACSIGSNGPKSPCASKHRNATYANHVKLFHFRKAHYIDHVILCLFVNNTPWNRRRTQSPAAGSFPMRHSSSGIKMWSSLKPTYVYPFLRIKSASIPNTPEGEKREKDALTGNWTRTSSLEG